LLEIHCFQHWTSLTSIHIPNSVKHIDLTAFLICTSLTNITFESKGELITIDDFQQCSAL
jgi:hypothetical protein